MCSFAYPARFRTCEDGRVLVRLIDFPHAVTDGKDRAEAMEEAIDCLGSVIAHALVLKEEIPLPSPVKRSQRLVPAPLWIAGKLALHLAMREQRISNSELARRLNVTETVVRRMLNPDHDTRSEKLQAALEALGKRLVVSTEAA